MESIMKIYFKLFLICFCFTVFTAAVSAEEYFASEYDGAVMADGIVSVNENEARIVYEWYSDKSGIYDVSFDGAVCSGCTASMIFKNGTDIKIGDITKQFTLTFDAGFNSIELSVRKNTAGAQFSAGRLKIEFAAENDFSEVSLECNDAVYADAQCFYYDDYGSDMSHNDVTLYRRFNYPAEAGFLVYAPVSGEYSAEIVMSALNQSYTSDVNMRVNGAEYPLKADTVTKLANLTNAADKGLMKKYALNNTVTLKHGINSIIFTAAETRDADNMYLFFLDCLKFKYTSEKIEIDADKSSEGIYNFSVTPQNGAEYTVEISAVSDENAEALPECGFSADGESYTFLSKGTAQNGYGDGTVRVISEYSDGGALYGVYRLKTAAAINGTVYLKIGDDGCEVKKITLIPCISNIAEVSAVPEKALLLPGETDSISVFARDENGHTANLDYLRKTGGITFKTSDRTLLAADSLGNVTALKPGIAAVHVSASDGDDVRSCDVNYDIYNEKYGFTVISAAKTDGKIKIKLLSPFGNKTQTHSMLAAEYDGNYLKNVTILPVSALNKGQIVTYTLPASDNRFKIISVTGTDGLMPVYDSVCIE